MKQKGLLEEIYDKAISNSEHMKGVESEITKNLQSILAPYKETLPEETFMKLEEIVVGSTVVAEKAAFIQGIRYGMQLTVEGISGHKSILKNNADLKNQQ